MALRDEMARSGTHLLRWRSYFPLLLLPMLVLALRDPPQLGGTGTFEYLWEAVCLAVAAAGLWLRAFTVGRVPANTSGRNTTEQKAERLNSKGMYSIVRHPLYLGNFLIWLGVSLFARTWWPVLIAVLAFGVYYERIILAEEEFLRKKFGEEFEVWAARTPAVVPAFGLWAPSDLAFSWKTVLARENSTWLATVVTFFLLEVIGDYFAGERPYADLGWIVFLCGAATVYTVLRWMKKHSLLSVEGR